jgi:hypothetical protein
MYDKYFITYYIISRQDLDKFQVFYKLPNNVSWVP